MYNQECKHENLKYYQQTDKVVCIDCGQDFYKEFNYPALPTIPYNPPNPMPDYPIYPIVTWSKLVN